MLIPGLRILQSRAVDQIARAVIALIAIKMARLLPLRQRTYESLCDQQMHAAHMPLAIYPVTYHQIATSSYLRLEDDFASGLGGDDLARAGGEISWSPRYLSAAM